jgi:hypothetical protein
MITFQMKMEIAVLDPRKAAARAISPTDCTDPRIGTRVVGGQYRELPKPQLTPRETEPLTTIRAGGTPAFFPAAATTSRGQRREDRRLRLLQTPSAASVGYRIGAAAKEFRSFGRSRGRRMGRPGIDRLAGYARGHDGTVATRVEPQGSSRGWSSRPGFPTSQRAPSLCDVSSTRRCSTRTASRTWRLGLIRSSTASGGKPALPAKRGYARMEAHSMLLRR